MLNWLLNQCLPLTLLLTVLLLLKPVTLNWLGARWHYSLWSAVPLLLLASLLPLPALQVVGHVVYRFQVSASKFSNTLSADSALFTTAGLVWGAGVLLMLAALLWQRRLITQQLHRAVPVPAATLPIRCKQSTDQQGPYVTGWWQATVLLPADFRQRFCAEQQQLVLRHELIHWQRGDLHANVLALLLLTLFWFHPLCWLAYRAYRQDQELACDALVLESASPQQKVAYSYALLSNAQSSARHWQLLTNHYGDKKMMKQRLQLLQRQQGFSKTAMALTMLALVCATLWLQQPVQAAGASDDIKPVMRVEPRFPVGAAAARTEGYVVAEFDIQPDGSVKNVQIIKSVPALAFDVAAIQALEQWKYSPSANGLKEARVQLDFVLDPVAADIERVEVTPKH